MQIGLKVVTDRVIACCSGAYGASVEALGQGGPNRASTVGFVVDLGGAVGWLGFLVVSASWLLPQSLQVTHASSHQLLGNL